MKIFLLTILLYYIFSLSTLGNYKIIELDYDSYYKVNIDEFGSYIPKNFTFYFGLPIDDEKELDIRLQFINISNLNFTTDMCVYYTIPNEAYLIDIEKFCGIELNFKNITFENNHYLYLYTFNPEIDVKYIYVRVEIFEPLEYLSIVVYSDSSINRVITFTLIVAVCCSLCIMLIFILKCICKGGDTVYSNMIEN